MTTLGYVVLAKRSAPRTEHGWEYNTLSGVFTDLAQAENSLTYVREHPIVDPYGAPADIEYVIGEVVPVQRRTG